VILQQLFVGALKVHEERLVGTDPEKQPDGQVVFRCNHTEFYDYSFTFLLDQESSYCHLYLGSKANQLCQRVSFLFTAGCLLYSFMCVSLFLNLYGVLCASCILKARSFRGELFKRTFPLKLVWVGYTAGVVGWFFVSTMFLFVENLGTGFWISAFSCGFSFLLKLHFIFYNMKYQKSVKVN